MITILIIILIAFVFSALFAGYEMAYLSCNKLRLRHMADEGNSQAQEVIRFHRNPKRFLTTILIGNNLSNVTIVGLVTYLMETRFQIQEEWLITAILALPIIIFAEAIPKDWFRNRADDFIYRFSPLLGFLDRLMSGLSNGLVWITDGLIQAATGDLKRNPFVTREEFKYVIDESTRGGVLLEHEKQLINTILNLRSVQVGEAMVPLAKFPKLSITSKICDVKQLARLTQTDAILVYEEIPSLVVGLVYVFDVLFEDNENQGLSRFLKPPLFVPQDTSAERAIFLLQAKHASFGVVTGYQSEVTGVAQLENLIRL